MLRPIGVYVCSLFIHSISYFLRMKSVLREFFGILCKELKYRNSEHR